MLHESGTRVISMQHWSKLNNHEGEPHPVGRADHAAVLLRYCGDRPQLFVTGGLDAGNQVLSDSWILDVESGKWREVRSIFLNYVQHDRVVGQIIM
jgi:hypothetical protein